MAAKGIYTFATREDFALGLQALEAEQPILYVQGDLCDSPDFPVYHSYQEIPDLGKAVEEHWISERDFRVLISSEDLEVYPFELWDGGTRYKIGRRTVERSLIWRPGGVLEAQKVVLQGQIATISENPEIIAFYRVFAKEATRGFYRQSMARIGHTAVGLYLEGYSLKDFAPAPERFAEKPTEKTLEKYRRRLARQSR